MATQDNASKREPQPATFYFRIVSGRKRIEITPQTAEITVKTGRKAVNIGEKDGQ